MPDAFAPLDLAVRRSLWNIAGFDDVDAFAFTFDLPFEVLADHVAVAFQMRCINSQIQLAFTEPDFDQAIQFFELL